MPRECLSIGIITEENEIAAIEKQLNQKVKESVDNNQKEYFLKERMKVIQEELGEDEDAQAEADDWLSKLDELKLDEKVDEKVRKEIKRFARMAPSSAESSVIRNYVETILDLPWRNASKLNTNLKPLPLKVDSFLTGSVLNVGLVDEIGRAHV